MLWFDPFFRFTLNLPILYYGVQSSAIGCSALLSCCSQTSLHSQPPYLVLRRSILRDWLLRALVVLQSNEDGPAFRVPHWGSDSLVPGPTANRAVG